MLETARVTEKWDFNKLNAYLLLLLTPVIKMSEWKKRKIELKPISAYDRKLC